MEAACNPVPSCLIWLSDQVTHLQSADHITTVSGLSTMKLRYTQIFVIFCLPFQVSAIGLLLNNRTYDYFMSGNHSEEFNLICEVFDNVGNETLIWYRGSSQVNVSQDNSINSSCIRVFPLSHEDNEESFTCLLKSNTSMKLSLQMDVKFDPILTAENNMTVELEKTVQLSCHFKANPQATMSWLKNGISAPIGPRFAQYLGSDVFQLTITKAESTDAGNYTCQAVTNNGTFTTKITLIVVAKKAVLPIEAIAAAVVVGALIILFGMFARRNEIFKSCLKARNTSL
uniref:Transmembrane and immunoglobulin domain containing 1 n=1 Tax=Leptobrachium leishanense TaxID=445787 RepID=A0A8C5Q0Q3_9ANUR